MQSSSIKICRVGGYQFGIETKDGLKLVLPPAVEVTKCVRSPSGNIEVLVLKTRLAKGEAWNYCGLLSVFTDGDLTHLQFHLPEIEACLMFGINTFVWDVLEVNDDAMIVLEVAHGSMVNSGQTINYKYANENVWLLNEPTTVSRYAPNTAP